MGPMNARPARRHWRTTSTPNEGSLWIPDPTEGAPAIRRLAIALMPSGNPRDSWIDVTGLPVTLPPYEHHSPLPSRHTSPRAAPGRALRTLRPRPRLHPRPHGLDQRHQRCGNAADGRQAERQAQAIERKVVLGLPKMPVQARAEVARPRRIERRSAGGFLRWHAAEFWWLRWLLVAPAASAAIRKPKPHSSNAPACSQREGFREDREEPVDPPARRSPPIATA